ncbi:MAG TPA: AAA family ATPase, partial [Armatimonadota bacterium]|nr:AAA family ATPase [Armatimonadota bacterium]
EITDLLEAERQRHEGMLRLQELRAAWALLDGAREQTAQLSVDVNRLENELAAFPKAFADPVSLRMRVTRWHQRGSSLLMKSWPLALVFLLIGVTMVALSFPLSGGVLAALGILLGGISGIQARRLAHDRFDICTECEVARIVDIERQLADYERCRSELTVTQRALSAVSSANHDEQRHALMVEIAKQEEILQRFVGPALTAEKVYQLERELVVLKNSLQETQQEEHRYLREVAVLEDVEQQMIDIDDGAEYWTNEVARAREEEQTLLLARDLLLQAGEHAHAAIANPLAARISPIFAEMTGGRYPKILVTGDAKTIDVVPVGLDSQPVAIEQLSKGTRDQLLLAVRIALGQVIAGQERTALFLLDDPLLHFDFERRREALRMLVEISRYCQIVIATHDESILTDLPDVTIIRLDT